MMYQWMRGVFLVTALSVTALSTAGCTGLGTLEDLLGGVPGAGGTLSGEVRRVDTRRQTIQVRTRYGQTESVDYDRRTEVLYRRQRYSVGALEPGDEVSMQLRHDRGGRPYTNRIYVERSVRERRAGRYPAGDRDRDHPASRAQVFQGRVGRIDRQRGWFELRDPSRGQVTVTLPYDPPASTLSRFRRLRGGEQVRIEGTPLNRGRVELRRFR